VRQVPAAHGGAVDEVVGGEAQVPALRACGASAWALDLRTGARLAHRADVPRPLLCLHAGLVAARLLRTGGPAVLRRHLRFSPDDLVDGSPVCCWHLSDGMSVEQLCDAALRRADATAANLLLGLVGGPRGFTRSCRELGDRTTRLDRWAPESSGGQPWEPRDVTTATALARGYGRVLVGTALPAPARAQLRSWLATAPLPGGWCFTHAAGTGWYGSAAVVGLAQRGARTVLVSVLTRSGQPSTRGSARTARAAAAGVLRLLEGG
ncbi:serine hydrolase, partial [Kineococcus vitellinus]|uniref:serine hydrolase n=1 Tax=Kineococcus vitellinus TaxID=2696565 RepID=UPI00196B3BFB